MQSIRNIKTVVTQHSRHLMLGLLSLSLLPGFAAAQSANNEKPEHVETIVVIRHGEKPHGGLGQLSCVGLNRALALPKVLVEKYGTPNAIFAPNPLPPMKEGSEKYPYVRPIATIEPTAIQLALPLNASIGFTDIKALEKELGSTRYADAIVFVAWEHIMAQHFAENMMATFGGDIRQVPEWAGDDFDSIYVLRLMRYGKQTKITFTHDHEGLDHKLPKTCPSVVPQS